jgi:hypothetical protein
LLPLENKIVSFVLLTYLSIIELFPLRNRIVSFEELIVSFEELIVSFGKVVSKK